MKKIAEWANALPGIIAYVMFLGGVILITGGALLGSGINMVASIVVGVLIVVAVFIRKLSKGKSRKELKIYWFSDEQGEWEIIVARTETRAQELLAGRLGESSASYELTAVTNVNARSEGTVATMLAKQNGVQAAIRSTPGGNVTCL